MLTDTKTDTAGLSCETTGDKPNHSLCYKPENQLTNTEINQLAKWKRDK